MKLGITDVLAAGETPAKKTGEAMKPGVLSFLSEFPTSFRIALTRRPGLVALNLCVLVVGMLTALLIAHEDVRRHSYDRWLPDHERLYRIESGIYGLFGDMVYGEGLPGPAAELIERSLPSLVEAVSRFYQASEPVLLKIGNDVFEARTGFADPSFTGMFDFPALYGDPAVSLESPTAIVLTERMARRLFGKANAVGQLLEVVVGRSTTPMTVSAVLADLPDETHFAFDSLVMLGGNVPAQAQMERWLSFNMITYVKTSRALSEEQLDRFLEETASTKLPKVTFGETIYDMKEHLRFRAVSVVGLDLRSPALLASGESYVQRLSVLRAFALLIFAIIGVTYANNTTALALTRTREMAVRKAVGASPRRIFLALLLETAMLVLLAAALAALLAPDAAAAMHRLVGFGSGEFHWRFVSPWAMLLLLLTLTILFGFYPALRLSRVLPAAEFNTGFGHGPSPWTRRVRAGLVLLQFIGAAAAIVVAVTFYRQWEYLAQDDPGYDIGGLYAIWNAYEAYGPSSASRPAFLDSLRKIDGVERVSQSEISPPYMPRNTWSFTRPGMDDRIELLMNPVDADFAETYRMPLLAGRFFEPGRMTDEVADYRASRNVVINDRARRLLGFSDAGEAVGETILIAGESPVPVTIIGVIVDAAFEGLKRGFEPRILFNVGTGGGGRVTLRYSGHDPTALRAAVQEAWRQFVDVAPIKFGAIRIALADAAKEEKTQATAVACFAGLALFFSVLGLYGLAALLMTERRKEIALRKLFGARAPAIAARLFGGFLWPVLLGNLIAAPLAGLYLAAWLAQFPSRIALSPDLFLAAALVTLLTSAMVVAIHVRRGMRLRPAPVLSAQ